MKNKLFKRILTIITILASVSLIGCTSGSGQAVEPEVEEPEVIIEEPEVVEEPEFEEEEPNEEIEEEIVDIFAYKESIYRVRGDGSKHLLIETEYDSNGNRIKDTEYNAATGEIEHKYVAEFDSFNNVVKEISFNIDGSIKYVIEIEYDDNGLEKKSTWYDAEGAVIKIHEYDNEYEVDSDGNVKTTRYEASTKESYEYVHDSNGNMIKFAYYEDGSPSSIVEWKFVYDSNGIIISESGIEHEIEDGVDTGCYIYYEEKRDSNGNMLKNCSKNKSGKIYSQIEYEYDSYGNKTKETNTYLPIPDKSYCKHYENEYDNYGNLIKTRSIDENEEYEYEYDSNGNLIKTTLTTYYGEKEVIYECEYDSNERKTKEINTVNHITTLTEYEYAD